jgi:hypothetical protein
MGNLAATYSSLERHADAVSMGGKAVEFFRRVCHENQSDLGECDV